MTIIVNGYKIEPYVNLSWTDLSKADLSGANLTGACLLNSNLSESNLAYANLSKADLTKVNLSKADLRCADLTGADLTGADLSKAKLHCIIGIASKSEEMQEAKRLLKILENPNHKLDMGDWQTSLAGWSEPDLEYPGSVASRKMPTLAKYFLLYQTDEKEAMKALIRVASGKESIYN